MEERVYLERPQHPTNIRHIPEDCDDYDIRSYHSQSDALRVVHPQRAPRERVHVWLGQCWAGSQEGATR